MWASQVWLNSFLSVERNKQGQHPDCLPGVAEGPSFCELACPQDVTGLEPRGPPAGELGSGWDTDGAEGPHTGRARAPRTASLKSSHTPRKGAVPAFPPKGRPYLAREDLSLSPSLQAALVRGARVLSRLDGRMLFFGAGVLILGQIQREI